MCLMSLHQARIQYEGNTPMVKSSFPASTGPLASDISAGIVDAIGQGEFFLKIANLVESYIPFEGLFVLLYSDNSAPSSLGSFKNAQNFQNGLDNYIRYTYILNPVYRAFQNNIAPDTYLIGDLLPDGYTEQIAASDLHIIIEDKETIGYRTPGWPKNTTEVLAIMKLPNNDMVEFSFITALSGDQTERCLARLKVIYPVLSSAILKHFEFAAHDFDTSMACPSLEHWFQAFGKDVLTDREHGVVKMILTGHSSNSVALNLGISLPTVKSHRRNIYSKFQISSQAELFSLFVGKLMENNQLTT